MTQMARNRSIFLRTEMMESLFAQDSNVLTWEFKDSEDQNIFFFLLVSLPGQEAAIMNTTRFFK